MTKDERKIIRDSTRDVVQFYNNLLTKKEAAAKEHSRKYGTTFVENVNLAEFSPSMKPVWDKFASTPELKALVQEIVKAK